MLTYSRLMVSQVRELMNRKMEPINIARSMAMPLDVIVVLMQMTKTH